MLSLFFYTYNQNNQFLCSKKAQNEDKWGYPLGNWIPCSYDLRMPCSYDLRMPCSYDLRIGIVMQLSYYVFVIFTATTVTFEIKYLIIIWLSGAVEVAAWWQ